MTDRTTAGPRRALKLAARTMGARVIQTLHYGGVAQTPEQTLTAKDRRRAYRAGERLARSLNLPA